MIQLFEFFQYSFVLILKRKCLVGASRVRFGESGTLSTIAISTRSGTYFREKWSLKWWYHRASTRIFARGCRDISRGCTRRKKVKGQSKNIMSGKIPADADRYRADGCVGRRQLTEALYHVLLNVEKNLKLGKNKLKLDFKLFTQNIVSTQQYPPRNRPLKSTLIWRKMTYNCT